MANGSPGEIRLPDLTGPDLTTIMHHTTSDPCGRAHLSAHLSDLCGRAHLSAHLSDPCGRAACNYPQTSTLLQSWQWW